MCWNNYFIWQNNCANWHLFGTILATLAIFIPNVYMHKTLGKVIKKVFKIVRTILEIFRVLFTTSKKFPKLFQNI